MNTKNCFEVFKYPSEKPGTVIWITGLSGSGKSTICRAIWQEIKIFVPELLVLDGDAIRQAFGNDLGYREADRVIQIKRIQNIAKLLADQGAVVLVAALYAHPELLNWNKKNLSNYFEIYLETSVHFLRQRDTKNLYNQAIAGKIVNVVGVDIPWYPPQLADMVIDASRSEPPETLARRIISNVPALAHSLETR
jgi:adenylylsulfate kinase-like enzyme